MLACCRLRIGLLADLLFLKLSMRAKDFDKQFDEGVDLTAALDLPKARRVLQEQRRVNVYFPTWMIDSLNREASKRRVTRQSVIKVWLAERLEATASPRPFPRTRAGGRTPLIHTSNA